MAFPTYDSSMQDQIALMVEGVLYTNLPTTHKTLIDGSSTSPAASSTAARVFLRINQITQYLTMAGITSAPAAAEAWFIPEVAYQVAQSIRPSRVPDLLKLRNDAEETFFASFSSTAFSSTAAPTTSSWAFTLQNIREYVVLRCTRRKDRLMPPMDLIDGAVQRVLVTLWNREYWIFRKRKVTITISTSSQVTSDINTINITSISAAASTVVTTDVPHGLTTSNTPTIAGTNSTPSIDGSAAITVGSTTTFTFTTPVTVTVAGTTGTLTYGSATIDKVATRKFYFNDAPGGGVAMEWLEIDRFHQLRAAYNSQTITGRPRWFTTEQVGDTWRWTFLPAPDQQYTAYGAAYVSGPGDPASATSLLTFAKFPAAFFPAIRDAVMAEVLRGMGADGALEYTERAEREMETLLPIYADVGVPNDDMGQRDVYNDSPYPPVTAMGLFGGGEGL